MTIEAPYRVVSVERRTTTILELWLQPLAGVLEYLPGEYVLLEDRAAAVPPRSYSIANAPRPDGLISLLITRVPHGRALAPAGAVFICIPSNMADGRYRFVRGGASEITFRRPSSRPPAL